MSKRRSTLLTFAIVYALYSIGQGFWGIAKTQETVGKVLIALVFAALAAFCGIVVYKLYRAGKEPPKEPDSESPPEEPGPEPENPEEPSKP